MIEWRGFLVLVIACTSCLCQPCVFQNTLINGMDFQVSLTNVATTVACFKAIALDNNIKSATLTQLNKLVDLYSFTDLSTNSPPPYNLRVDLKAGLANIQNTVQASDWDLHFQLSTLFTQLGDAHTLYIPPTAYENFVLVRPYFMGSTLDANNNQIVYTSGELNLFGQVPFSTITGVNATAYLGKQIVSINGIPIIDWLKAKGKGMGNLKDPAAQFNNALKTPLSSAPHEVDLTQTGNTDTYVFAGVANPVVLPNFVLSFAFTTGVADFTAKVTAPATRKRELQLRVLDNIKKYGTVTPPTDPMRDRERFNKILTGEYNHLFSPASLRGLEYDGIIDLARQLDIKTDLDHLLTSDYLMKVQQERQAAPVMTVVSTSNSSSAICASFTDSRGAKSMILTLKTFAPPATFKTNADVNGWTASYMNTIQQCITSAKANAVTNLIVDERSNGGGIICLALAAMVQLFANLDPAVNGKLLEPYNMRKTPANDLMIKYTDFPQDYAYLPAANPPVIYNNVSYYNQSILDTRGGVAGVFTPKWGFPATCLPLAQNYFVKNLNFAFSKVILFTDGMCGSACSLFSSKLRYDGKAALVSLGGIAGQPMETSSFSGGNVEDWTSIVPLYNMQAQGTADVNFFQLLPTTAFTRYNHRENYMGNQPLPREFQRFLPDVALKLWLPQTAAQTLTMFDTVSAQFLTFPAIQPLGTPFGTPYAPTLAASHIDTGNAIPTNPQNPTSQTPTNPAVTYPTNPGITYPTSTTPVVKNEASSAKVAVMGILIGVFIALYSAF